VKETEILARVSPALARVALYAPRLQTLANCAVLAFVASAAFFYLHRRRKRVHALAGAPDKLLVVEWPGRWSSSPLVEKHVGRWRVVQAARWIFLWLGLGVCLSLLWALSFYVLQPSMMLALLLAYAVLALLCMSTPILFFVFLASRSRTGRRGDRTHGTAQWHSIRREWWNPDQAVAAALVMRPETPMAAEGLVSWGVKDTTFAHFTWDQLSRHMLIVGATGSGKTTTMYHHLMLSSRMPWIYQDQKGDLPLRERFPDRPVWGLDTRGHRTRSGVWNPMEEVKGPEDVEVISALLFPDKGNMNDWVVRGARMLFEAMCKRWHFESLQQYVYMLEHTPLDKIIEHLPAGYVAALADQRSRAYYMGEIMDVLRPWINTSRIADVTYGRSTVTLDDFIERGGYVVCNEDKHLRQPVTLFWGMLLHRLRNRPTGQTHPLLLLMDEFGDAGRIPNMAQALALYRSKGVGIIAGIQSFSLIKSVYDNEWEAIRDGFGTQVIMTAHITPQLQMELTQQLGTFTMEHQQNSFGLSGGMGGLNVSSGTSTATRQASSLVPVDQWGYWSANRAVIVRGATGPTWWIPVSIELTPSPVGDKVIPDRDADWRMNERERIAVFGESEVPMLPAAQPALSLVPAPPRAPSRVERGPERA
jgi:type IV secretory pathway TraG/TraD family ATPase VirD4